MIGYQESVVRGVKATEQARVTKEDAREWFKELFKFENSRASDLLGVESEEDYDRQKKQRLEAENPLGLGI
jgi:hypothetical protein